jgi:hypothetical protein
MILAVALDTLAGGFGAGGAAVAMVTLMWRRSAAVDDRRDEGQTLVVEAKDAELERAHEENLRLTARLDEADTACAKRVRVERDDAEERLRVQREWYEGRIAALTRQQE